MIESIRNKYRIGAEADKMIEDIEAVIEKEGFKSTEELDVTQLLLKMKQETEYFEQMKLAES